MASIANLGSLRVGVELPVKNWNKNYGKVTDDVKKYPKTTDKALGRAGKAWERHAGTIKKASLGMVAFGTVTTAALGFAVKAAGDFQQSMTNTQAVAGATTEELKELTLFAREMGKQTVFSAKESADAMLSLASAGQDANEIMGSLKGTLNLAAATNADLSFASKTVASTLSQFNLAASESDRIANVFTATISASQANMDKLATSMSVVGPVAKSIGLSLEETTSILGSLFNAGLDASTAGTSLRQAIAQLLKPTDDAKEALKRLKVETVDSGGQLRSMTDIVRDLEKANLTAVDALSIFGVRAGPGMLALVSQGADAIEDLTEKVTGTNKAAEIAALQVGTFQGQIKLLRSALSELQITIGDQLLPVLTDYTTKLTGIINATSDWTAANPKLTKTLVTLGGVAGVTALALGGIGLAVPGIIKGAGVLKLMAIDVGIVAGKLGITATAAGVAALAIADLVAITWAANRAFKAWKMPVDLIAVSTDVLEAKQRELVITLGDIRIASNKLAREGLLNVSTTLGDLDINIAKINRRLGTAFTETTNLRTANLALARRMGKTSEEVVKLTGAFQNSSKPTETAADRVKRLSEEITELETAAITADKAFAGLATSVSSAGTGMESLTGTIQREANKQVAIIRQRTKLERDFFTENGIIQLGLVEKNVDEILTLHGKETKEKKDLRIKAEKEERKARDENLKEALLISETGIAEAKKASPKIVGVGKDRDQALKDLDNKRLTTLKKNVDKTNRLMDDVTTAQIAAGERRGKALVDEREEEDRQLKAAEISWQDFGDTVIGVFANVTRNNRIFQDTWIGSLTQWGIENRKILSTITDVWSGRADSIIGSATSIFGTMVGLIDSLADARREASRQESTERAERIARTAEIRDLTFREAARLEKELAAGLTEEERAAARVRGPARRGTRAGRAAQERFPFPGPIPTGGIQFLIPPPPPITIDQPPAFVPRRPEGTDRFGRPVAATPAMAPGRGGNVTFGDIIVNLPEGADIQNMDSAEWERILRDNIQPAAESIGLRFVRSDNLMAS